MNPACPVESDTSIVLRPYGYFYMRHGARAHQSGPYQTCVCDIQLRYMNSNHIPKELPLVLNVSNITSKRGVEYILSSPKIPGEVIIESTVWFNGNGREAYRDVTRSARISDVQADMYCRLIQLMIYRYILKDPAPVLENGKPAFNWQVLFTETEARLIERASGVNIDDLVISTLHSARMPENAILVHS